MHEVKQMKKKRDRCSLGPDIGARSTMIDTLVTLVVPAAITDFIIRSEAWYQISKYTIELHDF